MTCFRAVSLELADRVLGLDRPKLTNLCCKSLAHQLATHRPSRLRRHASDPGELSLWGAAPQPKAVIEAVHPAVLFRHHLLSHV